MKKIIVLILVFAMLLSFVACSANTLNGKYTSTSGRYSIDFDRDGTCTWYQSGTFFKGTYEKIDNGWQLNIGGDGGFYYNTVFVAIPQNGNLIVTGGIVDGETFIKE